jgi:predicted HicB family RNase H-like nuclease
VGLHVLVPVEAQVIASRRDRKPAREVRSLTVRLDPELFEQLERAAAERDLPLSFMVAKALRDFLPRLLPVEDMLIVRPHDA